MGKKGTRTVKRQSRHTHKQAPTQNTHTHTKTHTQTQTSKRRKPKPIPSHHLHETGDELAAAPKNKPQSNHRPNPTHFQVMQLKHECRKCKSSKAHHCRVSELEGGGRRGECVCVFMGGGRDGDLLVVHGGWMCCAVLGVIVCMCVCK